MFLQYTKSEALTNTNRPPKITHTSTKHQEKYNYTLELHIDISKYLFKEAHL